MDPRADFISSVEIDSTRVKSFRGFIFMCGGPHDIRQAAESVRSLLIREMTSGNHSGLAERIKLSEEIQDWFRDAAYSDLVLLEEHLASLSSMIILVVESEGAIAELGVFSSFRRFSDRMITLIANENYEKDSFIRLGPIQKLENLDIDSVLVYDWDGRDGLGRPIKRFSEIAGDIVETVAKIKGYLARPPSESVFRWDDPLHVMLLVCELCDLFGALGLLELEQYLEDLGAGISQRELKQFLFLLERCNLISPKATGNKRYFCAPNWTTHISFGLGGKPVDRDRLRVDIFDYYRQNDQRRASLIRNQVSRVG